MKNFYDRINEAFTNDGKYHGEDKIEIDFAKGCFYTWMEDVMLKLDKFKNGSNDDIILQVKAIVNAPSVHSTPKKRKGYLQKINSNTSVVTCDDKICVGNAVLEDGPHSLPFIHDEVIRIDGVNLYFKGENDYCANYICKRILVMPSQLPLEFVLMTEHWNPGRGMMVEVYVDQIGANEEDYEALLANKQAIMNAIPEFTT